MTRKYCCCDQLYPKLLSTKVCKMKIPEKQQFPPWNSSPPGTFTRWRFPKYAICRELEIKLTIKRAFIIISFKEKYVLSLNKIICNVCINIYSGYIIWMQVYTCACLCRFNSFSIRLFFCNLQFLSTKFAFHFISERW